MLVSRPNNEMKNVLEESDTTREILKKYVRGSENLPPPLSPEEEKKYIHLLSDGDLQARQILIEHNLRLVVHISKRFRKMSIDIEDVISVGTIGLVKAINTYDPNKNVKLVTYASRCIQNEILMFLRKLNKCTEISFDELLDTDSYDSGVLSDILGTDRDIVEKDLDNEVDKEILHKTIERLPVKEQEIIILRFGLNGFKEHTQKEVSEKIGISQSHISKLEQRILLRLKQDMKN